MPLNSVRIAELLTIAYGKYHKCVVCGHNEADIVHKYTSIKLADQLNVIHIGGETETIPSVMIVCKRCGHINIFALKVLKNIKKFDKEHPKEETCEFP